MRHGKPRSAFGSGCGRIRLAAFLLALAPLVDAAHAAGCKDDTTLTVRGTVGEIFRNKIGSWTIPVAGGSGGPCWKEMGAPVVLSRTPPPATCRKGATLTATIQVSFDEFLGADQMKLIRLSCE